MNPWIRAGWQIRQQLFWATKDQVLASELGKRERLMNDQSQFWVASLTRHGSCWSTWRSYVQQKHPGWGWWGGCFLHLLTWWSHEVTASVSAMIKEEDYFENTVTDQIDSFCHTNWWNEQLILSHQLVKWATFLGTYFGNSVTDQIKTHLFTRTGELSHLFWVKDSLLKFSKDSWWAATLTSEKYLALFMFNNLYMWKVTVWGLSSCKAGSWDFQLPRQKCLRTIPAGAIRIILVFTDPCNLTRTCCISPKGWGERYTCISRMPLF